MKQFVHAWMVMSLTILSLVGILSFIGYLFGEVQSLDPLTIAQVIVIVVGMSGLSLASRVYGDEE